MASRKVPAAAGRDALVEETRNRFAATFGRAPESIGSAPGRINIIGEHTDYSQGFVLPAAVPLYTLVAAGRNRTAETTAVSSAFGRAGFPAAGLSKRGSFADYLAGSIRQSGLEGTGLDLYVHSTLPAGSGLSSSASLLVAATAALDALAARTRSPLDVALAARQVENDFVGVPCGFMDQYACACARQGLAMLLDCLDNQAVDIPATFADAQWVAVYTGIRRELAGGGYARKVDAVREGVRLLAARSGLPGTMLRFLTPEEVETAGMRARLDPETVQLLTHVAADNCRVHLMRHALERQDCVTVGRLLRSGHDSLSRQFGVSLPAIDAFVDRMRDDEGVIGIRLTGAGMGGSLVALVRAEGQAETLARMQAAVLALLSSQGRVFEIPSFSDGVRTWKGGAA